jgi:hypothetical protein
MDWVTGGRPMRVMLTRMTDQMIGMVARRARDNGVLDPRTSPATKLAIEFGMRNIVVPYDPEHVYPGKHPDYFSASLPAMVRLAHRKGYRLVGANRYGFNLIFVKRGLHEDRVPEVPLESVLSHPRYFARLGRFEAIKDWEYETPE